MSSKHSLPHNSLNNKIAVKMNLKRLLFQNKNFRLAYYFRAEWKSLFKRTPQKQLSQLLQIPLSEDALSRVNYYNKLTKEVTLDDSNSMLIGDFHRPPRLRVYYYDSIEYLRYFNSIFRFQMIPGDVVDIPAQAAIVKSRPVGGDNENAVLLNMDKVRHFNFLEDEITYEKKKPLLIGRAAIHQNHRRRFYELYYDNAFCDLGDTVKGSPWFKEKLSITQHLEYKFILSLEGNDVATNLKWIMSSNSIAVMPKPKFETWYMEGRLIGGVHYIEIKEDYSDLVTQLEYYLQHEEEAKQIVANAHAYVQQFLDPMQEDLISLHVLQKYFVKTGQE